jgi:uncharacterized membrane protein YqjE
MSDRESRSFSDVLEDVVSNIQAIIRSEVRLAKTEVQEETAKAARAGGVLGAGALFGVYAVGFLLLAGLYALQIVVAPWLAALIVAVLVGIVASVLIAVGVKRMKRVHPRPEQTMHSIKENLEWARNQAR